MKNNSIKKIYIKNANCIRDFLNAEKVVEIIYQIYRKKLMGVLNIGSGEGISIKDFIYKEITNKKEVVSDKKVDYLVANIDKLKKQLIQNKSKLK
jgi:GDP-D-mannose dehydratase